MINRIFDEFKIDIEKGVKGNKQMSRSDYNLDEIIIYAIENKYPIIVDTSDGEKGKFWYLKGKGSDHNYLQKLIKKYEEIDDFITSNKFNNNKKKSTLYLINEIFFKTDEKKLKKK